MLVSDLSAPVSFLFLARLQFLANYFSHNFAHPRVLFICTLARRRSKLPLRATGLHLTTSLEIAGHLGLSIKVITEYPAEANHLPSPFSHLL